LPETCRSVCASARRRSPGQCRESGWSARPPGSAASSRGCEQRRPGLEAGEPLRFRCRLSRDSPALAGSCPPCNSGHAQQCP
jgi:hypothetical protein